MTVAHYPEERLNSKKTEAKWILAVEWLALLAIVALATFLRYWRIEEVPPGFNSDEAVGAVGALTTLRDGVQYSYEGQGGGGALGFYFAAVSFYFFGPSIAAIRGVAAWAGVVSIFTNYWAVREIFRIAGLNRARWIAGLSTLALAVSVWHIWPSRVAFATIGVPLFMLPSVFFLWWGLNHNRGKSNHKPGIANLKSMWPFFAGGVFLASLMYIYLSGAFAPPLYAAFFIIQWLLVKPAKKLNWTATPPKAYITSQFWNLFVTGLTAVIFLLPIVYVLLADPNLDPGGTRVNQAIFTNPQINQGDPWGLLWRSFVGNFSAYGVSFSWLIGKPPLMRYIPTSVGFLVFAGFLISLWRGLRGHAAYQFIALWYAMMLLPSILSPDAIPHNLRTIGATTPTYVFAAITVVSVFELALSFGRRRLSPKIGAVKFKWLVRGLGLVIGVWLCWQFWLANKPFLVNYFYFFPQTNDAQAAFHVYAVKMAEEINRESNPDAAFILLRNTAAGDIHRNFTTDFLVELERPPAAHYWVVDDERTLADDLTRAAAGHSVIRVVEWKTSKHTGADPKGIVPYYLEKYGYHDHKHSFEYFDIHTYQLTVPSPDFSAGETLQPAGIDFGGQIKLSGFALGDAGDETFVNQPHARSNDWLWLRAAWQKTGEHPENLKVSALIFDNDSGQLVTQVDKDLINNIKQVGSRAWETGAEEYSYFLILIPPGTPPGTYTLKLAVYGRDSQEQLPITGSNNTGKLATLSEFAVVPAPDNRRAKPEHVNPVLPLNQEVLPGLNLIGFETLPGKSVRSGQPVAASIIWQAGEDVTPAQDLAMQFIIKSADGEWPISAPVGLAGANYLSSQWASREMFRGWITARIPPALEPGAYQLHLRLSSFDAPADELLTLPVGEFSLTGWIRNFEDPQPQVAIEAEFGGLATLSGLDVETGTLAPGDTLNTILHWQADAEFEQDYTAFVQLIGPDGTLHGQVDHTPGDGQFPTTGWLPGEFIADSYAITLQPDAPSGNYQLAVGLYNPNTGERLPVNGQNCQTDVCLIPGLTVK